MSKIKNKRSSKSNDAVGIIILIILLVIINMSDFNYITRVAKDKNWPCVGYYTITSGYGKRNTGIKGASVNHKGIDIGCPIGTEVISVLAGTVVDTGYDTYRGYYIIVEHKGGVITIYQHGKANSFKARKGQTVEEGQVIMLSGNSGVSSGPHLHFEVKINGKNVNPKTWLRTI